MLAFQANAATFSISVTNGTYDGTSQIYLVSTNVSTNGACPLTSIIYSFIGTTMSGSAYNSSIAPTDAGSYQVTATAYFTCTTISSGPFPFTIAKATPILTVTNPTLTYTANTQSATVSSSVAGTFPTALKYNGSSTNPTNAGTYTITADFTPNDAANYNSLIGESAGNFTINKAPVTISDILLTKIYDGNPTVNVISNSSSGIISGDNVVITGTATNFSDKVVANNYSSTVTFNLVTIPSTGKEDNYFILGGNQRSISNGTITPKALSIAAASIAPRGYDGTRTVGVITKGTLTGFIGTETVTANAVGTDYVSGNVGTYTSTISYTLANGTNGGLAGNYSLVNEVANGTITKLPITLTASANTKVYDGTLSATATPTITTGSLVSGDIGVFSETYDTKTQGSNKVLTPAVVSILDATNTSMVGNYSITYETNTSGVITAKQLMITDPTFTKSKEYDKTVTVNTIAGTLSGVVTVGSATDAVTVSSVGTYSTSTVGTSKTITVVYTLDGADKDNYIKPVDKVYTDGVITAKQLTITDPIITKSKEYDKTVTVNTTAGTLSGVVIVESDTDAVTASAEGTYSSSTVGTNKTIMVVYTLAGADKDNYIKPLDKVYTDGEITAKPLTVTGVTTSNKVYDGTNIATLTGGTLVGVISPDVINFTASGTFSQSTVGTGIAIISTSTIDNTNYSLTQPTLTARDITAKPLTVTAKPGQTKVFGTPDPPNFTYTLSTPLLGSDVLTGALKRTPGEAIGPYAINQGTLTNLNYGITYISNNFEITPAPVNNTGTTKAYDLPNAFTPNGDGKNDKFKIIVNDPTRVNLISFQIYNRNGTLMFTTNKISEGWDGRYKGVMQDMGIYFVKLITLENGLETPRLYLLK